MIRVVGIADTREYQAAIALRDMIVRAWPDVATDEAHQVHLVAGAKCHGQSTRDVDLLILASFGEGKRYAPYLSFETRDGEIHTPSTVQVRSLCTVIEIKDHGPEDVRFVGTNVEVRYRGHWHSASAQNESQMYAVINYLRYHGIEPPFVSQLVWLRNVPNSNFPPRPHPIIGAEVTWETILNVIGQTRPPRLNSGEWILDAVVSRHTASFSQITDLFTRMIEPTRLDRQRMERINQQKSDMQLHQLQNDIGQRLVILRGRGGTGKTLRLLQLAKRLSDDEGARVLILTYNKALVADIRRLLTILGIPDDVSGGTIHIQTVHSFLYAVLKGLGIVPAGLTTFLEDYERLKDEALEYLRAGVVSVADREMAAKSDVEVYRWDYVFVDEGQDWPRNERELLTELYPFARMAVADGLDQLVRSSTYANWRTGLTPSQYRITTLKQSLRMKAGLARFASSVAHALGLLTEEWEPSFEIAGGKVIILEGPYFGDRAFHDGLVQENSANKNAPVDMLFCVPPGTVSREPNELAVHSSAARIFEQWGYKTWDGAAEDIREGYPTDMEQLRIVQYESCRGLEGWTVVNLGIDRFYDYKLATFATTIGDPHIPALGASAGNISAELLAARWLMIPLTRAMDTLVLQINDSSSRLIPALRAAASECSDFVQWLTK